MNPVTEILNCAAFQSFAGNAGKGGQYSARGVQGSSTVFTTAALENELQRPCILVVAHLDEADEACDELSSFDIEAVRFPALEISPGETNINLELLAERLSVISALEKKKLPKILVAPIQALMQAVPETHKLKKLQCTIFAEDTLDSDSFNRWLEEAGYQRVDAIDNPGEYSIRGGIMDIFTPGGLPPVRIDLFGDEIESIHEIDLETMGSDRKVDYASIIAAKTEIIQTDDESRSLIDILPSSCIVVLAELLEITEQGRGYFERVLDARGIYPHKDVLAALVKQCHAVVDINQFSSGAFADTSVSLPVEALPAFSEDTAESINELKELAQSHSVTVYCQTEGEEQRFKELLGEVQNDAISIALRYIHRGYIWDQIDSNGESRKIACVPYHELIHRFHTRRHLRRLTSQRAIDSFLDLEPGDLVVHEDHGIARFVTFAPLVNHNKKKNKKSAEEFLTLEFKGSAKLHVPASQIGAIQKYVGGFHGKPQLSKLGAKTWKKQKEDVSEAVRDLAVDMLQIQAAREAMPGIRYPADTVWQREFEAEFPYEETEDQLAAISELKRDMTSDKPMDRLVCGDVGFGKTEVAIRAAFKAVEFGKQVAILVPTTVLAEQHELTFRARFADYPFRIESISRFKTKKEQNDVLKEVDRGRVDIIIGTHRLLSKDVKFADLGLVIVDEEQRFGVEHKNRLLQFRLTADVLTLSATPIPRTLHMSMLGLRDISSLTTPPADRRAIVTEVIPYETRRIKQALERELAREGQIFFVHNRVYNIKSIADDVQQMVPDAKIVIGHGQMPPRELESVMLKFMRRQVDILVCTTIIESGIDIPTANTMIINDADMFGLSDLHQLRGRVGRYKHRAYCYLTLPNDRTMTQSAVRRLRAIENYSMLGAGFKIAMRDLEIRGAGNLLGSEQSGHISAVGYEMYCDLLRQAVNDLKTQTPKERKNCTVDLGIVGSLTKNYIPSDLRRIEVYRRLADASTIEEFDKVEQDLASAYGDPPSQARILLELARIKILAYEIGILSIVRHADDIIFKTKKPALLESRMQGSKGSLRLVGQADSAGLSEVYFRPPKAYFEPATLLTLLIRRLSGKALQTVGAGN